MTDMISSLPYTLINGNPGDASQVMADLNQIVNDVNANVPTAIATAVAQGAQKIVLKNMTAATVFNLPANANITGVSIYVVSGTTTSGASQITISNANNVYPSNPIIPFGGGSGTTGNIIFSPNSNISIITSSISACTFDISDRSTPGNGWNGAVVNAVISYDIMA